ncbi:hypothetical protein KY332_01840 [Candidatus Woesearchaeota archaeon]|nr:hypothetical protein [Candidatus Woesearchaeota archaeon]
MKKIICLLIVLSLINIAYAQEEPPKWPGADEWWLDLENKEESVDPNEVLGDANIGVSGLYYFFNLPTEGFANPYLYVRIRLEPTDAPDEELEPMGWAIELDEEEGDYHLELESLTEDGIKLKVNDESTKVMKQGESDTLSDGTVIGVIDLEIPKKVDFELDEIGSLIKENLDSIDLGKAPKALKWVLGKPKINIEVNGHVYGFKIAGNTIKEFTEGGLDNPHYKIFIAENVLRDIFDSEDPASAVGEAYKNGDIKVEPQRLGAKIKFWVAKKFMK